MRYRVGGRVFVWQGGQRLNYVRARLGRWVPTSSERATHVVHVWLPDPHGVWQAAVHPITR